MSDDREMHVKAEALRKAQEQPQNPVRAMIEITLMADGTFHLNGPWHDRILFEGLMKLADRAIGRQFEKIDAEMARRAAPKIEQVTVPPGVADKLRTRGA